MNDCYDTRSFSQSTIDAILEIWDAAASDGQAASPEIPSHRDPEEVLLVLNWGEQRHPALLAKSA